MIALIFDTETTGLLENRVIKSDRLPELIEFYGAVIDLSTGEKKDEFETLVRPSRELSDKPDWGQKKTITDITGLTNEILRTAPRFEDVAPKIVSLIESAPAVIAHNASFDQEIIDVEASRLGKIVKWPRVLCSVEQTIHLKGKRMTMAVMYDYLFNEKFPDAHRARPDTEALIRCCVELAKRGDAFI
jgi:DNA polymerase III epsilon subunit-like protein